MTGVRVTDVGVADVRVADVRVADVRVVGTAGHVDHGKSTLVRALTGTDPDRWAEEKARGLTIDLGFAHGRLPGGVEVDWIDVPGHVRFLHNMLAGVGALDACVLVVSATEGWKPQSEEHLRIVDLLGVGAGLVALTRADPAGPDRVAEVTAEVTGRVAGTLLEGAPVVAVDSLSGRGLDRLATELDRALGALPPRTDEGRPRLWVDRSFAARGAGTVVTGTLTGGRVAVGDELTVVGPGPAGREGTRRLRVRGAQTHGAAVTVAGPGRRLALNLVGAAHGEVVRGDALVAPGRWRPTRRVDAALTVLAALDHDVSRRGAYAIHLGSGEHAVRLRVLGPEAIAPGSSGLVRLHLPVAVPLLPGDRYVLREHGRGETIGGGQILDIDPVLPAARARPDRSVARVVAERGWVTTDELRLLTGETRPADVGGHWVVDPAVREAASAALRARVDAAGPLGLDVSVLGPRDRALLAGLDGVLVETGLAWTRESAVGGLPAAARAWLQALDDQPWSPPGPGASGVDAPTVRVLVRRGLVVERDGQHFGVTAVDRGARVLAALLADRPEGLPVSTVRDALRSNRRQILALLAHWDATGVTRRRGDLRVGGPLLPPHSGRP